MSISIQPKNDYSFLFSGLGGNSGGSTSNFLGDYISIKNGTYAKLMKAYYNTKSDDESVKSIAKQTTSRRTNTSAMSKDETKAYTEVQKATDDLKESADALLTKGTKSLFRKKDITTTDENGVESTKYDYDVDAIYSAVNDFVKDYNSVIKATGSSDVTDSSIANRVSHLQNTTKINEKALAEIGITINKDNTLSIDKDTFKGADMAKVQNLFNGTGSYAYSVSASASMINFSADQAMTKANTYTGTGTYGDTYNIGNLFSSYL